MERWSIPVDISGGAPTTLVAKEVEYNSGTGAYDVVSGGEEVSFSEGDFVGESTTVKWYHADIEKAKVYTVFWNGSNALDGYIGQMKGFSQYLTTLVAIGTHLSDSSNPHSVTKTQVGLGSVANLTASQILSQITAETISNTGLDVSDLQDRSNLFLNVEDIIANLAAGGTNATTVLRHLAGMINGNARMASQIAANISVVQTGTAAATSVTPAFIGQFYIKTDTNNVYIAEGTTSSDWIELT